jgi:hypothetical protein
MAFLLTATASRFGQSIRVEIADRAVANELANTLQTTYWRDVKVTPAADVDHEATARAAGFTEAVTVTYALDEISGWVRPGAQLEDNFQMVRDDTGETLTVKGWLAETNPVED